MRTCLQCGHQTSAPFCENDGFATVLRSRGPPASHTLKDGLLFAGRYRIGRELGRGGMGSVYEATHTGTGQHVAVKTLRLDVDADEQSIVRFFHEARITARLLHPNTVRVFDFGQDDSGTFYLVMEKLTGGSLADRLDVLAKKGRTMSEVEAASLGIEVLRSLAEAHGVGLVHRDLKPANIFLHQLGPDETMIKVVDFGIAKSAGVSLTQSNALLGTPTHMSPEQVLGHKLDGRSDLYSLGVVLFECVAGRLPFDAGTPFEFILKQVQETAPDLRRFVPVGDAFAAVVARALSKEPEGRFPDAAGMRAALEAVVAGGTREGRVNAPRPFANVVSMPRVATTDPGRRQPAPKQVDDDDLESTDRSIGRQSVRHEMENAPTMEQEPVAIAVEAGGAARDDATLEVTLHGDIRPSGGWRRLWLVGLGAVLGLVVLAGWLLRGRSGSYVATGAPPEQSRPLAVPRAPEPEPTREPAPPPPAPRAPLEPAHAPAPPQPSEPPVPVADTPVAPATVTAPRPTPGPPPGHVEPAPYRKTRPKPAHRAADPAAKERTYVPAPVD